MKRLIALMLGIVPAASCAAPPHVPLASTPATDGLERVPRRTLTVDQADAELWRPELRPPFRAPTEEQAVALERLVSLLMDAARTGALPAEADTLTATAGMMLERWDVQGRTHLVLHERPEDRHGAGAYLFAVTPAPLPSPWLLWEAPHAYHDVDTGTIAAALYFGPPSGPAPAAFFTNTLHRYTQTDGKRQKKATNPADACHDPAHPLNRATLAVARTHAGATVVQLHGFGATTVDDDGDEPRLPDGTTMVVSAGIKEAPTPLSAAAAPVLRAVLGDGVRLFPTEARALGATTNVEKRGLVGTPGARFLHLETSAELRSRLVYDAALRDRFGAALFALVASPTEPLSQGSP